MEIDDEFYYLCIHLFQISTSLSNKFKGPIQALQKLKFAIEQEISSFSTNTSLLECCQSTGAVYNERFRSTVHSNCNFVFKFDIS